MENLVIIGTGPAGLTAAIYAARAELKPLVIEGLVPGGQLTVSSEVENYPGFVQPVNGYELMDTVRNQALRLGARIESGLLEKIEKKESHFELVVEGKTILAKAVIVATGAQARRLPVASEPKYYGKGISGCATCDGAFFRNKEVLVVGGGNTAIEDALFLTKFASKVTIVHRRDYLRAEPVEISKAKANPKIEWMIPWVVKDVYGERVVEGAVLENPLTGEVRNVACQGIFVAIGHDPKTELFKDLLPLDEEGYITTLDSSSTTGVSGLFACGDVCEKVYKQAVVAAGSGCKAALDAQKYLENSEL